MDNINPSRVIVGFRADYDLSDLGLSYPDSIAKASSQLSFVGGFIAVVEVFNFLNAVVVSIRAEKVHEFVAQVIQIDPVEYCDYDYRLTKTYFDECSLPEHVPARPLGKILANHHGFTMSSSPRGIGSRIALIDTGISPHPYLPSVFPTEAITRTHLVHPWLLRDPAQSDETSLQKANLQSVIDQLASVCQKSPRPRDDNQALDVAHSQYGSALTNFENAIWRAWETQLENWQRKRSVYRTPLMPLYPRIFGSLRLISPLSRSFLPPSQNQAGSDRLLDVDGHGTAMAGVISALPPRSFLAPSWNSQVAIQTIDELELNAFGLAPYSELVALKCMHSGNTDDLNSSTVALIKALEYAASIKCDVVYIGLSLNKAPHKYATAIQRALQLFTPTGRSNALIVAPAGNEGSVGLNLPASCTGALSIAGMAMNSTGRLKRSPNSNSADSGFGEQLSFCAFGGSESSQALLPTTHFGWMPRYGTSIAAAIASSALAVGIGEARVNKLANLYSSLVSGRGIVKPDEVRALLAVEDLTHSEIQSLLTKFQTSAQLRQHTFDSFDANELGSGPISI